MPVLPKRRYPYTYDDNQNDANRAKREMQNTNNHINHGVTSRHVAERAGGASSSRNDLRLTFDPDIGHQQQVALTPSMSSSNVPVASCTGGSEALANHSHASAASSLRNFVLKVDCERGEIVHASSNIKAALALDDNALLGRPIESLLHPDDIDDFMLYCRCPADYISCLPQITKGSIAVNPSDRVFGHPVPDADCQYITFLCRMVNGHYGPNDKPQYTVVRVSGKQQYDSSYDEEEVLIERETNGGFRCGSEGENSEIVKFRSRPRLQKIFFSLVEVPTVSLKLELTPTPAHFAVHEYMLSSDQSPTILFADPRIERILGFSQVEVVGRTGYDFVMPKDQLFIVAAQFDAVLKCREPVPVAARLKTKSGKMIFTRSRVYLNLDRWTKKIKNYVTISSVISKRTAFKYFQRQIRTVSSLRKNTSKWNEMLNLLELTEEQKNFVSKMDLGSYLDDFQDCVDQLEVDEKRKLSQLQLSNSNKEDVMSFDPPIIDANLDRHPTTFVSNSFQEPPLPAFETNEVNPVEDVRFGQPESNFYPVPFIEEVIKFFPRDFNSFYKVTPSQSKNHLMPPLVSPTDSPQYRDRRSPSAASSTPNRDSGCGGSSSCSTTPSESGSSSVCNLVDSCCKHSNDSFEVSAAPGQSASCFRVSSNVRNLLNVGRNDSKPSLEFLSLVSNAAPTKSATLLRHLTNVKPITEPTGPKQIKCSAKVTSQKRNMSASKRQSKLSVSSNT